MKAVPPALSNWAFKDLFVHLSKTVCKSGSPNKRIYSQCRLQVGNLDNPACVFAGIFERSVLLSSLLHRFLVLYVAGRFCLGSEFIDIKCEGINSTHSLSSLKKLL